MVADDTGLLAAAAALEQLPDGVRATVFAEVDSPAEQQSLPVGPHIEVI
jgi:NADPH-dependent ferric siderophore reductase